LAIECVDARPDPIDSARCVTGVFALPLVNLSQDAR
jgi:hypothetical protein